MVEKVWRVDITTKGDSWATNALRFASVEEATRYAFDLAGRWMDVGAARVVPSDTPDRERYVTGDPRIVLNYLKEPT